MLGPLKNVKCNCLKWSLFHSSSFFFAEIGSLKCKTVFGSDKAYFRKKKSEKKSNPH